MKREIRHISASGRKMKLIILRPKKQTAALPGILWLHGGGYMHGMAEMVYISCGKMLAKKYGAVVAAPAYRLTRKAPYPAALEDCYAALQYLHDHRAELRIDSLIVGGESAGGGLTAAVCLLARDKGEIPIAYQFPLYPMLDCEDTPSSRNNHGWGWNTRKNHRGWSRYLQALYGTDKVPKYASPARETDYSGLPPCYTYICDGEPFLDETRTYIHNLRKAGIEADLDVYPGKLHGFDYLLFWTKKARAARKKLCSVYESAIGKRLP